MKYTERSKKKYWSDGETSKEAHAPSIVCLTILLVLRLHTDLVTLSNSLDMTANAVTRAMRPLSTPSGMQQYKQSSWAGLDYIQPTAAHFFAHMNCIAVQVADYQLSHLNWHSRQKI